MIGPELANIGTARGAGEGGREPQAVHLDKNADEILAKGGQYCKELVTQ
jgi:hypothetical protein